MDCPLASRLGADTLLEAPHTSGSHKTRRVARKRPSRESQESPANTLRLLLRSSKMILTTSCLLLLATQMVRGQLQQQQQQQQQQDSMLVQQDNALLQQAPSAGSSLQQQAQQQQPRLPKQVEYLVRPNSPTRIECKLPPMAGQSNKSRTIYWNFHGTSTQNPRLLCFGDNCNSGTEHGVELDFDPTSGAYDLVINNATYELNDGVYYCDFRDTTPGSRQAFVREYRLTVLLEPQQPSISASSASAREGQEYQLSCQSSGGNPEPNITWFKNGVQLLAGQGLRMEQARTNGTTTSLLTWIPTIDDQEAVYKCEVSNKAMGERAPLTQSVTLSVEYAPRITVGPYNPLKVMQGERATISCQVDANPPVKSIRWFRDGHQVLISNQFNHTIHEVKISDAAVYSCQADNGIAPFLLGPANSLVAAQSGSPGSGVFSFLGIASSSSDHSKTLVEARLQLEVLYAPRVQIRDPEARPQPFNTNDSLALNCSVDSWPPAHEFVWTKSDDENWRRTGALLEFQVLTANDMGNYTCTAFNRLEPSGASGIVSERQGSASFAVQVNHRPGLAEIIVGRNGETELGNKTFIQCRAKPPGFPEPKYIFWKMVSKNNRLPLNRNSAGQDPVHTIYSARPEDEAKYGCMAQNALGPSNEAFGDLVVNEPPTIVADQTWRASDERRPGDFPYSITVRATGKPEPRVTWYHRSPVDGRRIELSSAEMQMRFRIETQSTPEQQGGSRSAAAGQINNPKARHTVISTLSFKSPLEVDDRGLYTIEFSNGLSSVATEGHQLHIHHAPIAAIKNLPVVFQQANSPGSTRGVSSDTEVAARTRAGFNLGETVTLTCRVSAYPRPQFFWHSQSSLAGEVKPIQSESRYRTDLINVQDDIWESTLSFSLESESDYGDYMCVSANQEEHGISPSLRIIIRLDRKSPPEPPVQVDQIDATQDSVTLQWIPGFDGGYAQNQFIVQYAPEDGSGMSLMRRFGPIVDDQQMQAAGDSQAEALGPKFYDCLSMNPCTISNLQPRQAYLMRLRARNELGYSREFSEELRVSTRANVTQIPRIQEAYFDSSKNILRFRVEPNPEYLLNNLVARIEARGGAAPPVSNSIDSAAGSVEQTDGEWRRYPNVLVRHEQGEAYLDMHPDTEQLRLTLCSRLNETLCGSEYLVATQSAVASFIRDQHGFTISILASTLILILVISGTATTLYSCCHSRKAKKAAALDRVDAGGHLPDNKALGGHVNGGLTLTNGTNGVAAKVGSHGSTTSTNSTSANGQLQSIDSINNGHLGHHNNGPGSTSDQSSDHSRQAKLDSMLPPNYSHYADRASLMLEQQQQQQQQQQQAYMQDKLGSPFGLPNSALLYPNQMEPQIGDYFGSYDPSSAAVMSSLEQHPMDAQANTLMMNSVLSNGGQVYDPNQMNEASMYSTHQQMMDEYNNYNTLASQQQHDQMMESAYGTTAQPSQVMAQPHQASYDNNANQSYCQSYGSPYDQQQQLDSDGSHYQQDLAAARQQMYGTLTRNQSANQTNGYLSSQQVNGIGGNNDSSPSLQQQQQEQYLGAAGLMPPPPPPQESDYGTTGRNGRLIREIIV